MVRESPYKSHIGTNYVPSDSELCDIKHLVAEVEPDIDMYNAQIEEIKRRRDACIRFVESHRALIAPIKRIPDDILCSIFMLCLPEEGLRGLMRSFEAPLLLSHVCRRWRALTVDAAIMWSCLYVYLPGYPSQGIKPILPILPTSLSRENGEEDRPSAEVLYSRATQAWRITMERKICLVSLWLSRAKACPLTIRLVETAGSLVPSGHPHHPGLPHYPSQSHYPARSQYPGPDESPVNRLLALFQDHSERWKNLALMGVNVGSPVERLSCLPPSRTPQLQSLLIRWLNQIPVPGISEPHIPAITAVQSGHLHSLCLDNFNGDINKIPARWDTLTQLSLRGFPSMAFSGRQTLLLSPEIALEILGHCPALVRCELQLANPSPLSRPIAHSIQGNPSDTPKQVRLPQLRDLAIDDTCGSSNAHFYPEFSNANFYHGSPSANFYHSLDVPSIRSLTWTGGTCWQGALVLPFLQAWGHQIVSLEFGRIDILSTQLMACLSLTPNVTQLTINVTRLQPQVPPTQPTSVWAQPELGNSQQAQHRMSSLRQMAIATKNEWLSKLTPTSGSEHICPKLGVLRFIADAPDKDVDLQTLQAFVQSRRNHSNVSTLKSVIARFMEMDPKDHNPGQRPNWHGRWGDENLNASLEGEKVIHAQWQKQSGEPQKPRWMLPTSGLQAPTNDIYARIPFQSPWDETSRLFTH
ncbi:hypothetical protein BKA70DRAFT_1313505 [Coprinopsis sp. MPI-PUGE-AT-0042]|nr:hypothetical protein BKA70DRAFT_1313505 [Coprinopsis sp. MPI-PUGE-AT-0042]